MCVFLLDEVENELDACEVEYEKVGCFREKISSRALSDLIFNDRKNIQWDPDEWENYMKRQVLKYSIMNVAMIDILLQVNCGPIIYI